MIPYRPEPFANFYEEKNARAIDEALQFVSSQLGQEYPIVIGEERITAEEKIISKMGAPIWGLPGCRRCND